MLSHSKLSRAFRGEALNTAVHLINLSHSHVLDGDVPERVWIGKDVSYGHLRVFDLKHLCTFLEMKGLSLIASQMSVFSWVAKLVSSGIRL